MASTQTTSTADTLVLALDIGTSSVRSLLFDTNGDVVAGTLAQISYDLIATADGGAYVDADLLVDLTCRCIDATLAACPSSGTIAAVGMSTFWHGLLGLDTDGRPTIPVLLWADTRSGPDVDELRLTQDQAAFRDLTGCVFHSSYWPAKLRWLMRTAPHLFTRTTRWCSFADYLLEQLTGSGRTSVCMASGTGLIDIRQGNWAQTAIDLAGISIEQLPEIAADGAGVLSLRSEFAARWPALRDAVWFPGLGDGACANAGTGAFSSARIALTLGTSGAMRIAIECRSGAELTIPEDLWAYRLDHRRVVLGAAISNGGVVLAWFGDLLGTGLQSSELDEAAHLPPDSTGLTVLPFLVGERSPIWNDHASAVVAGLTLATTRAQLIRAGMEAVSLRFARLYRGFQGIADQPHQIVANGAALLKSPAWQQITADALGHDIVALDPSAESSARGAAVMALLHSGIIASPDTVRDPARLAPVVSPVAGNVPIYQVAVERQRELEQMFLPSAFYAPGARTAATP